MDGKLVCRLHDVCTSDDDVYTSNLYIKSELVDKLRIHPCNCRNCHITTVNQVPDSSYMRHLTPSSLAVPCRRTVSCLRRASQPAASPVRVQAYSTKTMLCEPQQAPTIKEGDKLPEGTFSMLPEGAPPPPAGKDDPIQLQLYGDIIKKGKNRVVVFGLPGTGHSIGACTL